MPLRRVSFPATAKRKNMFSNSASVRPSARRRPTMPGVSGASGVAAGGSAVASAAVAGSRVRGGEAVCVRVHVGEAGAGAGVEGASVGAGHRSGAFGERRAAERAERGGVGGAQAGVVRVLIADHSIGPVVEQPAVLVRHAHDAGERPHRQIRGDLDEVGTSGGQDRVHEHARPLGDRLLQPPDRPRSERGGDDAPEPRLRRRILIQHHGAHEAEVVNGLRIPDLRATEVRGEGLRITQHALDVGVREHTPVPGPGRPRPHRRLLDPAHRRGATQLCEALVGDGVGIGLGMEDLDRHRSSLPHRGGDAKEPRSPHSGLTHRDHSPCGA